MGKNKQHQILAPSQTTTCSSLFDFPKRHINPTRGSTKLEDMFYYFPLQFRKNEGMFGNAVLKYCSFEIP
jgi:hypothetical protein